MAPPPRPKAARKTPITPKARAGGRPPPKEARRDEHPRKARPETPRRTREEPLRAHETRPRLALDYTGGTTLVAGDPELAELLAHALDTADLPRDRLTHGFHTYPARMHWATAARVLEALTEPGDLVIDPFCGSGTVLVEARVRGASAVGIDLNPLALRLAKLKSDPLHADLRETLVITASAVRARSEERVQARDPIRAKLPRSELVWYEPHVLKEMAGLFEEIKAVEDPRIREALTLVFSSLVVKFSRQRSDTAEQVVERRLRKGLVSEFFERKAFELAERLAELEGAIKGPRPKVIEGDARHTHELAPRRAELVLTSPPYGGTYDYVAHHQRRFAWLGIDPRRFAQAEIGARRRADFGERFERELFGVLRSAHRALKPGGLCVMLMGDALYDEEVIPADELVAELGEQVGFTPVAVASQPRRPTRTSPARAEHLMALRRR